LDTKWLKEALVIIGIPFGVAIIFGILAAQAHDVAQIVFPLSVGAIFFAFLIYAVRRQIQELSDDLQQSRKEPTP